jgi:hypothetical protein
MMMGGSLEKNASSLINAVCFDSRALKAISLQVDQSRKTDPLMDGRLVIPNPE